MLDLIGAADADSLAAAAPWVELGLQHEQQHQELLLTDALALLALNPLAPALRAGAPPYRCGRGGLGGTRAARS